MYSGPNWPAGDKWFSLVSIFVEPIWLSTLASPLAAGIISVPRKSMCVIPVRWW